MPCALASSFVVHRLPRQRSEPTRTVLAILDPGLGQGLCPANLRGESEGDSGKLSPEGVLLLKEGCFKCPRFCFDRFSEKNKTAVSSSRVARCAYPRRTYTYRIFLDIISRMFGSGDGDGSRSCEIMCVKV